MSDSPGALNLRMEALEMRIAHQESAIGELSSHIFDQQKLIEKLENQVKLISGRLKDLADSGGTSLLPNERPPHY